MHTAHNTRSLIIYIFVLSRQLKKQQKYCTLDDHTSLYFSFYASGSFLMFRFLLLTGSQITQTFAGQQPQEQGMSFHVRLKLQG